MVTTVYLHVSVTHWSRVQLQLHIFTLDSMRIVKKRHEILYVGARKSQRVYFREFSVRRICRYELPELIKRRVDSVHPFSLSFVRGNPFDLFLYDGLLVLVLAIAFI